MDPWYVVPAAILLDFVVGDPVWLPHPIRWMGKAISVLEPIYRRISANFVFAGFLFSLSLVAATWVLSFLLLIGATAIHPIVRITFEILLIYYAVSIRSLETSAMAVYHALKQKSLQTARVNVSHIIGRDVNTLSEAGIASGAVESVAENLVDGVLSPIFYACIGGAPLAMTFKMVSTLDSMIGYKNETYEHFGKAAARMDDLANYIPARLSVIIISISAQILSKTGALAFRTAFNEGANHTSPNAGYPEASFSGALMVKLNGPSYYGGHMVVKPFIGTRFERPDMSHIKRACDLMIFSSFVGFGILWGFFLILKTI